MRVVEGCCDERISYCAQVGEKMSELNCTVQIICDDDDDKARENECRLPSD